MPFGALAGVISRVGDFVFDGLLGVVPGPAGVSHEDGEQLPGDDGPGEEAAERLDLEGQSDRDGREDCEHCEGHELALGRGGADADRLPVVGLYFAFHQAGNPELAPDFFNDEAGCATD